MTHPSTTQDGTKVVPVSRVERDERQKRSRRIGLVVLIGLVLTVGVAGKALAWTAGVTPSTGCEGTDFNGTVGNEPGNHTATVSFGGESKSVTVPAEGGNSFTLHFNSHDGGPWSYTGTWSESSEVETASGTLSAVTDCEEEQTPPPPPTIKQPDKPKPVFHGTATNKKRAPVEHAPPIKPTPPVKKVAPKQPELGALPFTGPREDMQRAMALGGLVLLVGGTLLVRASRRKEVEQG